MAVFLILDLGYLAMFLFTAGYFLFLAIRVFVDCGTRRRDKLILFALYLMASCIILRYKRELRPHGRWLLGSFSYKRQVLVQPNPPAGQLKHLDWDGWGFAGMNTEVYVVFDPSDSLAAAAKLKNPGKPAGIPCAVQNVLRLERHWYSVTFYTEQAWDDCG